MEGAVVTGYSVKIFMESGECAAFWADLEPGDARAKFARQSQIVTGTGYVQLLGPMGGLIDDSRTPRPVVKPQKPKAAGGLDV